MKQYHNLLERIIEHGTRKDAARVNMPGTTSLFGDQIKFDLSKGFPLLTTKKISLKNIAVELIWFLKGNSNIKYLVDNNVNIWNEDGFNFYLKRQASLQASVTGEYRDSRPMNFNEFINVLKHRDHIQEYKTETGEYLSISWGGDNVESYQIGDTGVQYPVLWRKWEKIDIAEITQEDLGDGSYRAQFVYRQIDQIAELIKGLKTSPLSRRHIITAWDPANLDNMALNACHCLVQFNCRPLTFTQKIEWVMENCDIELENVAITEEAFSDLTPSYYLDCQMYQRSADIFLGVPFNIASYALLTYMLCKVTNMIPGIFVHTFGDVHIYDDHKSAVQEILKRTPKRLPKLELPNDVNWEQLVLSGDIDYKIITESLRNYNPDEAIKANLSTGLIK